MSVTRRQFLGASIIGAAGVAGCGQVRSNGLVSSGAAQDLDVRIPADRVSSEAEVLSLPQSDRGFPLGVMAGDVSSHRAIVWTRFTGPGQLALRVDRVPRAASAPPVAEQLVAPGPDGFVHVDVVGLDAATRYRYVFLVRDGARLVQRGPSGLFRTAHDLDAELPVTFAGTSCTNQVIRPFPALQHAAARSDLDFFVHAGDHVYCDLAYTRDEYRARYLEAWPAYGMRGLHASVGQYVTWDDHEVSNNWNPEAQKLQRVANARSAFFEHNAIRRDATSPDRIWRSVRWGRTLELFVLDCRGERVPSTRRGAHAQYISPEQFAWLVAGLRASPALFKFVVNSVPITRFPGVLGVFASDRWQGYAEQRDALLAAISGAGVQNVWWLSGDLHFGCVGRVEPAGPHTGMREVLMGPGRQLINRLVGSLEGGQWDAIVKANNYALFRVDPRERALDVSFVGEYGDTLFARKYWAT